MTPEAHQRARVRTPVLAITALAWLALALGPADPGTDPIGSDPSIQAIRSDGLGTLSPHDHQAVAAVLHSLEQAHHPGGSTFTQLAAWALMLTAMTGPLLIPHLRHVIARSLPRRRLRASLLLAAGHALTWSVGLLALSAVATALREGLPGRAGNPGVVTAGLLAAAAWQVSPVKQQCLNRCHAHPPLAAFGRAADLDAARFGASSAIWCLGSCWALMLLPFLVATPHLVVMAVVSAWMWLERIEVPASPSWRLRVPARSARIATAAARSRLSAA